ncbi:MAG: hypothetical protein HGB11_15580 [Chlorobiales bacterium]|nr:hypothetical protein [Chlorobiales bacterium]
MNIYLFAEGQTEQKIVENIVTLVNKTAGRGKAQVNKEMRDKLGPPLEQSKPIRALIMRDVDNGETSDRIVQSVTKTVQKILRERDLSATIQFQPHKQHPNVYLLTLTEPDLRLALHLATWKWQKNFVNATIDDYVLSLALREKTAKSFLQKKGWEKIQPEKIISKVTKRIPNLLQENGIPLCEAKDYVRLYAAVIQEHTSPAIFAGKTIANADEADKQAVFAPLLMALAFLGGASS